MRSGIIATKESESATKGNTGVHLGLNACVSTYGFRCHYRRSLSPAGLDSLCVCHREIIFAVTSLSHVHLPFIGPHRPLPLHLTAWKSMRASRSGVKIELRSKYSNLQCKKLKEAGGRGGGSRNCCADC